MGQHIHNIQQNKKDTNRIQVCLTRPILSLFFSSSCSYSKSNDCFTSTSQVFEINFALGKKLFLNVAPIQRHKDQIMLQHCILRPVHRPLAVEYNTQLYSSCWNSWQGNSTFHSVKNIRTTSAFYFIFFLLPLQKLGEKGTPWNLHFKGKRGKVR